MINQFNLSRLPNIQFGIGKFEILSQIIVKQAKNVVIVVGGKSLFDSDKLSILVKELKKNNIIAYITSIFNEPTPANVDLICNYYRPLGIDFVVAIGGGSVLDAGKAISAMLTKDDSVSNYLEQIGSKRHDGKKIPFIAVPTTSGTGSEATKNAVLSEVGENGYKKSLRHDNFMPDYAVIDPELTLTCPPQLTASCGLDAFSQLLESFLSTNSSTFTDALALNGMKFTFQSLEKAVNDVSNIGARTDLSYSSLLSGITLANAGLGLVHGFAASIGGYFKIPHGIVCGTLIAVSNDYTLKKILEQQQNNLMLNKYSQVGQMISKAINKSDEFYARFFINELYRVVDALKMPKFSEYGITEADVEKIIFSTDNKYHPVKFSKDEQQEIFRKRL